MTSSSFAPLSIATASDNQEEEDGIGNGHASHGLNRYYSRNSSATVPSSTINQQPALVIVGDQRGYWQNAYRGGFSTSICDLFQDPYDRSSCCALTCCGTFLQDRNVFLLTGEMPPPWWIRIPLYVGGFVLAFVVGAIFSAPFVPLWFVIGMALRASILRQRNRYKLQEKMAQQRPNRDDGTHNYYSTRGEHWSCSCVSNDKRRILVPELPDDWYQQQQQRERRQKADFCFHLWKCLSWSCCDACCFSWWHWCGVCATAQEDRELKRLVPLQSFWRDYVTFQPFGDYYPRIEWLRAEANTKFWSHLSALSELSRQLLFLLQISLLVLLGAAAFHLFNNFKIAKVVVIAATLFQSFLILYFVFWRNHKFDISLDAIIKLFASGFILATMVAFMVELLLDTIGEIGFAFVLEEEFLKDHPEFALSDDDYVTNRGPMGTGNTFKAMAKQHFPTLLIYLLFKAVVVAALVEELTKYFCFWMVEHPDFIYGGSNTTDDGEEHGEEAAFTNEPVPTCPQISYLNGGNDNTIPPISPSEAAISNLPTFQARATPHHSNAAAAITVGMVATAVGFSCSENLMYVFSQGSVAGEISILLARSALPVHSICAAIQSIGVVRRDVEQDADYQIGWALLPAVVLHGVFDYALMTMSFVQYLNSPDPPLGPDGKPIVEDVSLIEQAPSLAAGAFIAAVGVAYYVVEAKRQQGRLSALEMTNNEIPSTVGIFV